MAAEQRRTAVIAEDEYLISLDVAHAAAAAGLEVVGTAANGEEAVALVKAKAPAVALLDIKMPRLDGLAAARRIREEAPTPVVLMTAYETPEMLAEAKEAGVGAYLVKPPKAPTLQRAVEIAVARHDDLLALRRANQELKSALARVRTLEGILSICAACKKIRVGEDGWQAIESYLSAHTDVRFSHGICPECTERLYPELLGKK